MAGKSLNRVQLIGNLGKDPEVKYTPQGTPVAKLTIATNERFKDKAGEWQDRTEWHNVVLWQRLAEIAGEYLKKGGKVYIEGRLQTRSWDDKTIRAEEVHDRSRGQRPDSAGWTRRGRRRRISPAARADRNRRRAAATTSISARRSQNQRARAAVRLRTKTFRSRPDRSRCTSKKMGAPFFALFAKSGNRQCLQRIVGTEKISANGWDTGIPRPHGMGRIVSHPCKERKDGAPIIRSGQEATSTVTT